MTSSFLSGDADLHALFKLIQRPESELTRVDFQEQLLLASVRAATRIWKQGDTVLGFAFVDAYNNLWFETESDFFLRNELETEMVEWGVTCMQRRNAATNSKNTLDCCCRVDNLDRIRVLEKHGFVLEPIRSLRYARSLETPLPTYPLPDGFSLRSVAGKDKVEQLVALHRAAFGTDSMNVEQRLAMMCTPQYIQALDLVAVAPNGEFAAFCVCGFDDPNKKIGYTDPIGTHYKYQRIGLGKAILSAGLAALKNSGATIVGLGTSSTNIAMQKLASALGFVRTVEKLWFSKVIGNGLYRK